MMANFTGLIPRRKANILSIAMPYPVFPGFLCFLGLLMLYIVFGCRWHDLWLIRHWRRVTGTIVRAKVDQKSDSDGTTYSFDIEYTYEVDKQTYRGTNLRTIDQHHSSLGLQSMTYAVEELPPGTPVEIVHHPRRPKECMMVRQLTPLSTVVLIAFFGVVLSIAGILWLLLGKNAG